MFFAAILMPQSKVYLLLRDVLFAYKDNKNNLNKITYLYINKSSNLNIKNYLYIIVYLA